VEVDGPVTDAAAAQVGDEGLPDAVDQRAAEEDRDARVAGVGVDLVRRRGLRALRIQGEVAGLRVLGDGDAVDLQQARDDLDVLDFRYVAQYRWRVPEQRGDHRLRHQVLGPPDLYSPLQRHSAVDSQDLAHVSKPHTCLVLRNLRR